jgi:hypothetical protein
MNAKIVSACEAFSLGQSVKALPFIADDVEWHIVGDLSIIGKAGVENTCAEATAEGNPNFENIRVIEGKSHVIVEGHDLESDVHYCDIYTVEENLIQEITSYCLTAFGEDFEDEEEEEA